MVATKLKNLSVTSVDLVDQGANPDAHIRLFKRGEQIKETDPDMGLFRKFVYWLKKELTDVADAGKNVENDVGTVEKEAQTFAENISREQLRHVTSEMFDCCYALSDSLCSIICDSTLTTEEKKNLMEQSVDEFSKTVKTASTQWAAGQKMLVQPEPQAGIQKSVAQQEALEKLLGQYGLGSDEPIEPQSGTIEKEVMDTMQIDKSKMTPEEQATLAGFEKKYGMPDNAEPPTGMAPAGAGGTESPAQGEITKGTETTPVQQTSNIHPEVAKALAEYQELAKRQNAEVEELKKSLEIEHLKTVAQKYEVLGKNAQELAEKLYTLKKAGGTVYDDYVALLDENVTMLTKGGMFSEIGSNRQGTAGTADSIGIKAAELQKNADGGMASPDAIIKAWEENPELAAQYEKEYMGR